MPPDRRRALRPRPSRRRVDGDRRHDRAARGRGRPRRPRDLHRRRRGRDPRSDARSGGGAPAAGRDPRRRAGLLGRRARGRGDPPPPARLPRLRDDGHRRERAPRVLLEGRPRGGDEPAGRDRAARPGRRPSSATTRTATTGIPTTSTRRGSRATRTAPREGTDWAVSRFYEVALLRDAWFAL